MTKCLWEHNHIFFKFVHIYKNHLTNVTQKTEDSEINPLGNILGLKRKNNASVQLK